MLWNASKAATIQNAASVSQIIDLETYHAIGIIMPAAWTTANLTFLVSDSMNTPSDPTDITGFLPLTDDSGAEFTVTAAAGKAIGIRLTTSALLPFRFLVVRSGTSGTPVAQAAQRTVRVICKHIENDD